MISEEVNNINSENLIKDNQPSAITQEINTSNISKDELLKALDEDFATSVSKVYVNSLKQEVGFKEVSVKDQKTISRVMIANESRQDVIYDAQCAIINKTALLDGFDIYQLSEFDRLKLLIALYQNNMFANQIKFTCQKCGAENQYQLDFGNTLRKLDEFDTTPREFEYENKSFKYKFTIAYPKVKLVSEFYKSKYAKPFAMKQKQQFRMPDGRPQTPQTSQKVETQLINMEYINLFLKKVEIENKQKGTSRIVDLEKYANSYGAAAVEEILSRFTQDVLYSDNGALHYVAENLLKKMNDSFDKHACIACGEVYEGENSNQVQSFL